MLPKFLTPSYPLEKNYFLVQRFCLTSIGFYPETRRTWLVNIWSFICFCDLAYCSLTSLYYVYLAFRVSVPAGLDALCPDATSIMALVKMLSIWYYRNELKILIQRVRKLLEIHNSEEKMRLRSSYYTTATRLSFMVTFLGMSTALSYVVKTNLISILRYYRGEPILYEMPYFIWFPEFFLKMPWFPIAFILSHSYGYISVCCFTSGDGLFCSFCYYITCLLKILAVDLKDVLEDLSASPELRHAKEKEVCYKLSGIIYRYNEIADIVSNFSDVLAVVTLAQFITASIVIGICAINLLLIPGYNIVIYGIYTSCVTAEIFLYCIGGTALIESSEDLATTAYFCPWYTHTVKIQKMVLTLLTRTQRSLIIKIPFFTPSLPVLTSILRATGSFIALFRSLV